MSGVGAVGSSFGTSTPARPLPPGQSAALAAVAMPILQVTGATYSQCTAGAIQTACVLASAAQWVTNNATNPLARAILAWEQTYGYTSAWFTYQQPITLTGETTARTLTWSMFVAAQGQAPAAQLTTVQATYGAPQLSGSSTNGSVLYVQYAAATVTPGIQPAWINQVNPKGTGTVFWTLYDPTLTKIQAQGSATPYTSFDPPANGAGSQNSGYQALLGNGDSLSGGAYPAGTVPQLLAYTGASVALVDYAYPLQPQYAQVSDQYCPNGATSCKRAVVNYYIKALSLNFCDCGTAQYVESGEYNEGLEEVVDRSVVTVAQTAPTTTTPATAIVSSQLLQEYDILTNSQTMGAGNLADKNTSINPTPAAGSPAPSGSWWLTITRAQALQILAQVNAGQPYQIIQPLDGTTLIATPGLMTPATAQAPASVLSLPASGVTFLNQPTDPVYWSKTPIAGLSNTYLGVELMCDDTTTPSTNNFIAGYNVGAVEQTSTTTGGFSAPAQWAHPILANSPAQSTFATSTGAGTCTGFSYFTGASQGATLGYFYNYSNSCTPLITTDGPGSVCPTGYAMTPITDGGASTDTGACLACPVQNGTQLSPSATMVSGVPTYSCVDANNIEQAPASQSSPLYAITTACSTGQNGNPGDTPNQTPVTYSWVVGDPSIQGSPTCGSTLTETRTVACMGSDGLSYAYDFCAGTPPWSTQTVTTAACTLNYSWVATGLTAPTSTCSATSQQTTAYTCEDNLGETYPDSICLGLGLAKPVGVTTTTPNYTGCSYAWVQGGFGAASGCSTTATETQTVTCLQSDGQTVANSLCAGYAAAGPMPPTTKTVNDTATCGYNWVTGAWSSPTSTCSASAVETRTVACESASGAVVADSNCTSKGAKPAASQTVAVYTSCPYEWSAGGFGGCGGGTSTWTYSAWSPTAASCGNTQQTRSASCAGTPGTGTQTRTITCIARATNQTVNNSLCAGSAGAGAEPVTSQSCTPTNGCGGPAPAPTSQTVIEPACSGPPIYTYGWSPTSYGPCTVVTK